MNTIKLVIALLAIAANSVQAGNISLGQAAEFNVFVKGNMTVKPATADTEGRVAVGGNLIIDGGYSFAHINASAQGAEVIVAGNVVKTGSGSLSVHGGTPASQGQLVYGGRLSGSMGAGTASKVSDTGINFNAAFDHLTKLSAQLAQSATPNVAKKPDWSTLTFTPAEPNASNVYVIDITQQELTQYSLIKIDNKNIAKDALIVFNVKNPTKATSVDFKIAQMDLGPNVSTHIQDATGRSAIDSHILFNFHGVTDLKLSQSIYGSILAPSANITSSAGVVWGHVIANSWKGNS